MKMKQKFKNIFYYILILLSTYIIFSGLFVAINIYDELYISKELQTRKKSSPEQKIIAIFSPSRPGEKNQAIMVRESAEKMGHLVYSYSVNDKDMDLFLPAKYMNELLIKILNLILKPDLHLAMSHHFNLDLPNPKIMYLSVPPRYIEEKVINNYPKLFDYNNFIDINLLNGNSDWLSKLLNKQVKSIYAIVGVPANSYKKSNGHNLLLFGSLWGRKTSGLYGAIRLLAKQDYMFFIKHNMLLLGKNDKQQFTQEAQNLEDLQERLNYYGIGLCVHSQYHLEAGLPSSRIFEIISSGAVAISDKNPFIIKYFADNILYFDQTLTAEEIFQQINDHVKWVKDHPQEAAKMAKNAHQILQKNFTTEKFIQTMLNNNIN